MQSIEPQRALTLWQLVADEPVESEVTEALVLRTGKTAPWQASMPAQDPVLVPAQAQGGTEGVLAALVLPRGRGAGGASVETTLNGVRLQAGMHLLRHADCIQVGEHVLWVAASSVPGEQCYDPALHGEDLFCFRLKSRFEPGDELVVCPGLPDRACGMKYSRRAWELGLACHGCGGDPSAPAWRPEHADRPARTSSGPSASARLFALARAGEGRAGRQLTFYRGLGS